MKSAINLFLGFISGLSEMLFSRPQPPVKRSPHHLSPEWGYDHRN